jgi:hypothetical protein
VTEVAAAAIEVGEKAPGTDPRIVTLGLRRKTRWFLFRNDRTKPFGWLISELRNSVAMRGAPSGEHHASVIRAITGECGSPALAAQLLDLAIQKAADGRFDDEEEERNE